MNSTCIQRTAKNNVQSNVQEEEEIIYKNAMQNHKK